MYESRRSKYFIDLKNTDPNDVISDIFGDIFKLPKPQSTKERISVSESDMTISIDLPGVKSADLTVKTKGQYVDVTGTCRGNSIERSFELSQDYDPSSIDALLEDGVLTLTFKKSSQSSSKTVNIRLK